MGQALIHPDHRKKRAELSAWGHNSHLRHAQSIFSRALEWEYIPKNPFKQVTRRKPLREPWHFVTPQEFKKLLDATTNLRTRCLYGVMYGAGLRSGEAINLLWDGRNIDFERGRISIVNRPAHPDLPGFKVKDYEMRSLPIPTWLQAVLSQ